MSPRPSKSRKISALPVLKGFRPYGLESFRSGGEPVFLFLEEYEAIRLCDYDRKDHEGAARLMDVSRPTFTRIYASAREKIAKAFVEARQLVIEGGKVYFDSEWYICNGCHCFFNQPDQSLQVSFCPLCGSTHTEQTKEEGRSLSGLPVSFQEKETSIQPNRS